MNRNQDNINWHTEYDATSRIPDKRWFYPRGKVECAPVEGRRRIDDQEEYEPRSHACESAHYEWETNRKRGLTDDGYG
jgi:hypothetical protein